MSENKPKSSELIQAQVATFVAERVGYREEDGRRLFKKIGDMALGDVEVNWYQDGDGKSSQDNLYGEYTSFLREVGGSDYESIKTRAEILGTYEEFEPLITELREALKGPSVEDRPDFLGKGANGSVFSIVKDGKKYAVRIPKDVQPSAVDVKLSGAILSKGIPHIEQVIAASYKNGVTVSEVIPGKSMDRQTLEDITSVTDDKLSDLVDTVVAANKRGIEIDANPSNLLYDTKEGYGLIDFHSKKVYTEQNENQSPGRVVGHLAAGIMHAGRKSRFITFDNMSDEELEHEVNYVRANYELLGRYKKVVREQLVGADKDEAIELIDSQLHQYEDMALNPHWIEERRASDAAYEERHSRVVQPGDDDYIF